MVTAAVLSGASCRAYLIIHKFQLRYMIIYSAVKTRSSVALKFLCCRVYTCNRKQNGNFFFWCLLYVIIAQIIGATKTPCFAFVRLQVSRNKLTCLSCFSQLYAQLNYIFSWAATNVLFTVTKTNIKAATITGFIVSR